MLAKIIVLLQSPKHRHLSNDGGDHDNDSGNEEKYRFIKMVKTTLSVHQYSTLYHWKQEIIQKLYPRHEKLIQVDRHVHLIVLSKIRGTRECEELVRVALDETKTKLALQNQNKAESVEEEEEMEEALIDDLVKEGKVDPRNLTLALCLNLDDPNAFGHYPNGEQYNLVDIGIDRLSRSLLHEFSPEEREQRVQLAACYRIFEMFGWTDTIYGHLTARSAPGKETFLINPFGLLYDEVTASSLVRIDLDGNIDHGGIVPEFGINRAGYVIHSAVHEARPDINCVMHCHFADATAVSCLQEGIAAITQTSHILGEITYHDYEGIAVSSEERLRLQKDLGKESKVLILRNHGVVTCGATIGEAFLLMFTLVEACKMQVRAQAAAGGCESKSLLRPSDDLVRLTRGIAHGFNKEGFGQRELSAYMRRLDRIDPSYRL